MNIKLTGCGPKYAALLHEAGFSNTERLSAVTPELLHQKLVIVNTQKEIALKTPHLAIIECWVNEARNSPTGEIVAKRGIVVRGFTREETQEAMSKAPYVDGVVSQTEMYVKPGDERGINIISGSRRKEAPDMDFDVAELPGYDGRKNTW
jgi:hypothetical protein